MRHTFHFYTNVQARPTDGQISVFSFQIRWKDGRKACLAWAELDLFIYLLFHICAKGRASTLKNSREPDQLTPPQVEVKNLNRGKLVCVDIGTVEAQKLENKQLFQTQKWPELEKKLT